MLMGIHFLEIKQNSVVCRQSKRIFNYTNAVERLIEMRTRDFPKQQVE
jgi:glutamyl/glutaminyl-tRNA synthetase